MEKSAEKEDLFPGKKEIQGRLLQIQRFSLHDGPGIRSTVFLKGCPLRCLWCHNPESMCPETELAYRKNRCTGCGQCVKACPAGALSPRPEGILRDAALCRACLACVSACPSGAMEAYGKAVTPSEALEILLRDRRYYERTGGGVTFSGGEPLSQPAFVVAAARLLRAEGIPTAIETSLYASPRALEEVAAVCDYIMADLKVMDETMHEKVTGQSNRPILENLVRLIRFPVPVRIRIPVVPGVNDGVDNALAVARFLTENTPYREIELLPMHKLAEQKYTSLGRDYPAKDIPTPGEETMELLTKTLTEAGITVIRQRKERKETVG